MAKRDFYEVLGVSREATLDQIKKAYRAKALQFHPDRTSGDKASEEKFKEATEAYTILADADNRRKYDQFGHAAFQQGGFGNAGDFGQMFAGFEDIFGDLFGSFFGAQGGGRSRGRAGKDVGCELEITFEEAAFGVEKEVEINRRVSCEGCGGSGSAPGTQPEKCRQCSGTGQYRMQQGFFTISRTCHVCGGKGEKIASPCTGCGGQGLKMNKAKIKVRVPAGIDHGQRLRLNGEGEAGVTGGPAGDLYVVVSVKEHALFEREESEVICDIPISYTSAVLGDEIEVPTLDGGMKLKIPAGTPSGKVFRLKNKGITILGTNRRGDQHVRVYIKVPEKLSAEHQALLEKLREKEKEDQVIESKSLFEKVKNIFA